MRPAPRLAVYREGVTLLVLDGRAPVSDGLFGARQLWEVLAGHLYLHSGVTWTGPGCCRIAVTKSSIEDMKNGTLARDEGQPRPRRDVT